MEHEININSSEIKALKFDNFFITARKRSFRRLCFHRCLSTGKRGSRSLSRRGLHPRGGLYPRGVSVQGVSVQGRSLSRGVSVQGGLCLGCLCPGGSLFRGVSVRETPCTVTSRQYTSCWNAFLCYTCFCL